MHDTKKIYSKIFLLAIIFGALFWGWSKYHKNFELPDKIPFAFTEPRALSFPENICNIADFGAIPDGETKNTESFRKAIETCAEKGGGKVFVPEGQWLTGAIHLKSNINLNLHDKAEIIFSDNPDDYLPVVFTRFEGMELYNYSAFIYAKDAQNIAITGKGTLNGQDQFWQSWKTGEKKSIEKLADMIKKDTPSEERIFGFQDSGLRPSFIEFVNCQNIWLENFFITSSPRWTIHPIYCENILMDNLRVETLGFNSDGIVIDSSKNVLIENCTLKTGDDTIAIKSGLEKDGWRVNRPSENIVIRNTKIEEGHSGIAIGSEMSGGVRNVFLYNLYLDGIDQGIRAKSTKSRGGYVENVWAKNISINIATNSAFQIDSTYPASAIKSNNKKAPIMRNFFVENLSVGNVKRAIVIEGLKNEPISDISFFNIRAKSQKSNLLKDCKNINFKKSSFEGPDKDALFETKNCEYTLD
jgi:polygalacturonase